MTTTQPTYGTEDASYKAAGGIEGLIQLADAFYDAMSRLPEAKTIRDMHPTDLSESSKKLAYFLSGWLGGPRLYKEHYGPIAIPTAHKHLPIGEAESHAWMLCMQKAVDLQPYDKAFKSYLIEQLQVPADRIRMACNR